MIEAATNECLMNATQQLQPRKVVSTVTPEERLEAARVKAGRKLESIRAACSRGVSLLANAERFDLIEDLGAALKTLDSVLSKLGDLPPRKKTRAAAKKRG